MSPREVLHGQNTDQNVSQEISQSLKEQKSFSGEILNYTKDGTPYWNHLVIDPVYNDSGELQYFVAVQYDTTDRRNADDFHKTFLASAGEAIIAMRPDGIVSHFNRMAEQLLGYSPEEVVGLKSFDFACDAHELQSSAQALGKQLGISSESPVELLMQATCNPMGPTVGSGYLSTARTSYPSYVVMQRGAPKGWSNSRLPRGRAGYES